MVGKVISLDEFFDEAKTADDFYTLIEVDRFVRVELKQGEEVDAKVFFQEAGNTRTRELAKPSMAIRNEKTFLVLMSFPNEEAGVGDTIFSFAVLEKGGRRDGQFTVYFVVRAEPD